MKYIGKTNLLKKIEENKTKKEEEKEDLSDYIEISDEAAAIIEEIKTGFEKLRLSNLRR